MKKELLLSSLIATSLVSVSPAGAVVRGAPGSAVVAAAVDARFAEAVTYRAENLKADGVGSTVSILLLKLDDHAKKLITSGADDLEMVIRVKQPGKDEYEVGDDSDDDTYFYLKPLSSYKNQKTYIGFSCNSSVGCETGEVFFLDIEGDTAKVRYGKYTEDKRFPYLPEFIHDKAFKRSEKWVPCH